MDKDKGCLVFPFSRVNANAISALLASLDINEALKDLPTYLPNLRDDFTNLTSSLQKYEKIILALSVYSTQYDEICEVIKKFRSIFSNKSLFIIVGGPHPIGEPLSLLLKGADVTCTGEGEWVFPKFIEFVLNDKPWNELPGIAYLVNGKIIKNPKAQLINLDDYPPFSVKRNLIRPIEITRGCAWKCRFCQIRSRGIPVRHRSVKNVIDYVKHTINYFTERRPDIRFISPNALSYGSLDGKKVNLEMVERLLTSIRETIGEAGKIYFGSFPSEVRPETISKESVLLLKKYTNVKKIVLGGQSGSNQVLAKSDRGHSSHETERAVRILINEGFEVNVDIIFGLPGEDQTAVEETKQHINNLVKMGATIHSHTFMPLVGTPFASESPGEIDDGYITLITNLQQNNMLSGFHVKQEREAKKMARRRAKFNKRNSD